MNPPATDAEIEFLEQSIGFELPLELKALYKKTNGQMNIYSATPVADKYATNLLGNYDFLSIEEALRSYQQQQELCSVDSAFSSFKMNEVEIRLFHQHLLLEGVWKQRDFNQAELNLSKSTC